MPELFSDNDMNKPEDFTSSTNQLFLYFESDSSEVYPGFLASWKAVLNDVIE